MSKLLVCWLVPVLAIAAPAKLDFSRDIRPILSDKCFSCHGPDEKKRMVGLRLDTRDGAFGERKNGAVIVPGNSAGSKLVERIAHQKAALRMPPASVGSPLNEHQVALIKQWIDGGALWTSHWAFEAPKPPLIPDVITKVKVGNAVDNFIIARLEREGLKMSPVADRPTLLRRLSFDLTGLPPTPAEIATFVADKSSAAYQKQVDRLLASQRYGEKMAMSWLDLARYADTHGYHIDSHRDMSPWRDWVIQSFNENKPFDQFTVEQLAGDLMPGSTVASKTATGFNRNHMINFEGGAIPEEYQAEYVADRVETTSVVWMGLTMGCAKCHDHKYDPMRQKDYYQMAAFFNTLAEKGLDGRKGNAEPMMLLPSPEKQMLDELRTVIPAKEKLLPEKEVAKMQIAWEKTGLAKFPTNARQGLIAHYELDDSLADVAGGYRHGRAIEGEVTYGDGIVGRAASFGGQQTRVDLPGTPEIDLRKPFTLAFWVKPTGDRKMTFLAQMDKTGRGWSITWEEPEAIPGLKLVGNVRMQFSANAEKSVALLTKTRIAQSEWTHITIASEGSGSATGLKIFLNGKAESFDVNGDAGVDSTGTNAAIQIQGGVGGLFGQLDDFRIYSKTASQQLAEELTTSEPLRWMLFNATTKRNKDQSARLKDYFLSKEAPVEQRKIYVDLKELKAQRDRLELTVPSVMVMADMEKPRDTFILARGDYATKGEQVMANSPAMLEPIESGLPKNRYGLARWLVNPNHPLTARVAVNRYWQNYFGIGLVKTAEDFGSQGEPPSHQELLDYLAIEFVRSGWDVKAMQRLIVNSATYQQSSQTTASLRELDPENRLLARGPRFRLPAETVRDNALFVSGLLNSSVGGKSVFPYQPPGVWEELSYGGVYSAQTYKQSHGSDLYRRSMYTFWKRTAPPASLSTFDAPDREKCIARRAVTNTPLQALVLWNDPTYLEASRLLAARMLKEGGKDTASRIRYGFELATGRKPQPKELVVLTLLVKEQTSLYAGNIKAASELLSIGESPIDPALNKSELAGWTTLASTLLNLDEVITKE